MPGGWKKRYDKSDGVIFAASLSATFRLCDKAINARRMTDSVASVPMLLYKLWGELCRLLREAKCDDNVDTGFTILKELAASSTYDDLY